MDGLSVLDFSVWEPNALKEHPAYPAGNALGWLYRGDKQAATNYPLVGRLYVAKSGWLLLSVPNALVRGVFDALSVPGAELPRAGVMNVPNVDGDVLNAHISVMNADEVSKIGVDKINERGHMFAYRLGGMKEIDVKSVEGVSKVWAIHVASPALAALRKSYGLTPLPNGDHDFHITVAVRRKKVLQDNEVRKAAAVYNFKGDVQGVSLRKTLHQILDQLNKPGLAYNNARTGEARAIIAGDKKTQQEVLDALRFHLAQRAHKKQLQEGVDYDITPLPNQRERLHKVTMKPEDIQKFIQTQGFNRLAAEPPEYQKQWINERYRLKPNKMGDLVGAVPRLAKKQLFSGEPVYDYQLTPGWQDEGKGAAEKQQPNALSRSGQKDVLHGGEADNLPDRDFSPRTLAKGTAHEHEHTNNDQVAKEIAKDHLSEDADYYEKVEEIEKGGRDNRKGVLKDLHAAKTHSDNKRYDQKTQILRRLMSQSPHDWVIDDNKPYFKGVTHTPTRFRFHTDPHAIDPAVKEAFLRPMVQGIGRWATNLGAKGIAKGFQAGAQAFRGPMKTLGTAVPEGMFFNERNQALQAGNQFLSTFKPQGFHVYAGRVKTPQSIAGHGDKITHDLLGFRLSSNQAGYGQQAVDNLTKQLTDAGITINKTKLLNRPGYHGWNIAGTMGQTPVEFQLTPRRLQGFSAADHSMVYKPHESGVIPWIGQNVYKPLIQRSMNVFSPIAGIKTAYTNPYTPYRSVYMRELLNQFNQRQPITYDHNLPVFKNIQNQLMEIKNRGDFILRTQRNYDTYRSQLDPGYRNYLAMQALHGDTHQPAFSDRMIEQYGNNFLGALGGGS